MENTRIVCGLEDCGNLGQEVVGWANGHLKESGCWMRTLLLSAFERPGSQEEEMAFVPIIALHTFFGGDHAHIIGVGGVVFWGEAANVMACIRGQSELVGPWVNLPFVGRGLGGCLVRAALELAKKRQAFVPLCHRFDGRPHWSRCLDEVFSFRVITPAQQLEHASLA
jgi:hypothetical protein